MEATYDSKHLYLILYLADTNTALNCVVLKWVEISDNSSRNYNAVALVPIFNCEQAKCCSVLIQSPKPTSTQPRPTPNPPPSPLPKPLPTPFSPPLP